MLAHSSRTAEERMIERVPPEPHTDSAGTSPEAASTDDTPGTIR